VSTRSHGTPRLSVITPLFNCLSRTQAMLASLRESIPSGVSYEVILVDDGSTDGTRGWLAGLGEPCRVILNERNLGFGAATNRGAAAARGEVLALLNNDLVLRRGWLSPMLWALALLGRRAGLVGNLQIDAASGKVDHAGIFVNPKGKPEHDRNPPHPLSVLLRPRRRVFAVTGACMVVRADTWRRLGGFDESFVNGCEDVDLCLRAREAGLRNVVALRSRVLHHVSSSPGRKLRDEENTWRLVRRWRDELAVAVADAYHRPVGWDYFWDLIVEPRDIVDRAAALRTALYLIHLAGRPPDVSLVPANAAIDLELARWREMFSH
jgi:GT2 family glycosyltransferase